MSNLLRPATCYQLVRGKRCISTQQQIDALIPTGSLWPVSAQYSSKTRSTWVGFTTVPPTELQGTS